MALWSAYMEKKEALEAAEETIAGLKRELDGLRAAYDLLLDGKEQAEKTSAELTRQLIVQAKAYQSGRAVLWAEGFKAGQGSMLESAGGEPLRNPYEEDE